MQGPPNTMAPTRIPPGTRLNGIYEIDHLIASGGMGEVYKGHAIETGDPVAIKLMLPDLAANEAALALFRKEASALHYLYHEAIVRYYVFTVEPTLQCPYLAMEFVEGESLSDLLRRGPLSFEAVQTLMRRIAGALEVAHERGIIHRDVSPDNVIISGGQVGRAKIIDFGIARSTQAGAQTVIGGGFAGKYNYVSPEQLGLFGGDVTAKSDIYSLGLVLVEALTGQPLDMSGSQLDVIEKRRKLPDLDAIDARIKPLITEMLQPNPDDRPASMAAVASWSPAVAPAPRGKKPAAAPPPPPPSYSLGESRARSTQPQRRGGPSRSMLAILAGVALVLIGGGATTYFVLDSGNSGPPAPPSLTPIAPAPSQPSTTLANTPPTTPTMPVAPVIEPPKSERVVELEKFIDQYDGGDCFFITRTAVTERAAKIEGYGASLAPFQILDDAFRRVNGFEADIGLWQVTAAQCPAVSFMTKIRGARRNLPRFQVTGVEVKGGQDVSGIVTDFVGRSLNLLLVDDAGQVRNVSSALGRRKQGACVGSCPMVEQEDIPFTLRLDSVATGPRPRLLIAVSSAEALESLRTERPGAADKFFERLLTEATSQGQTLGAAAKYLSVLP